VCVCVKLHEVPSLLGREWPRSWSRTCCISPYFPLQKKNQFNHSERDFNSTKLSLLIQKLIVTFSTSQLVLINNFDYSNAFDIVSHTFLLLLGACGLCVCLTGFLVTEFGAFRILSSSFGVLSCFTILI